MSRELITSWGDYQTAIDCLLGVARQKICIYDEDLDQLKLASRQRLAQVRRTILPGQKTCLQIALRNAELLRQDYPLLIKLLSDHAHLALAQQTPPHLAHLRDSMLIIDDKHALIRFEQDLPRSKLLIDEAEELKPYVHRFSEIWSAGGTPISKTTLGL